MARGSSCAHACGFSLTYRSNSSFFFSRGCMKPSYCNPVIFCSVAKEGTPYKSALISEAVRLLGPPAKFEASKLKVDFMGRDVDKYSRVVPRVYILSHCDFTANLTLNISNIISVDQLQGWYSKDDVVAEWKDLNGNMCLVVHCYVSGPNNLFVDLTAEFRYRIFTKELPLVLQAVLYGDSNLFQEHPELMDAAVWVYFHSRLPKYNCIESWGPLKDAAKREYPIHGLLGGGDNKEKPKLRSSKSFLQALFTLLF